MKVILKQKVLLEELSKILGPTTTKPNFPILNSVLIETYQEKLKLTVTDLDITIISFIEANIIIPGKTLIPMKRFISIIRELPEKDITLELIENNLLINCENIEFKLNTLDSNDFPQVNLSKELFLIRLEPQALNNIIQLTSFSVEPETSNYVLNGVFFEIFEDYIIGVATDGKRLSFVKKNLPSQQSELKTKISFILPIRAIMEIQKLIKDRDSDIFLFQEKNNIGLDLKNSQIIVRPIAGEFIEYDKYISIPQGNKLTIDRINFLSSLKRASLLTIQQSQGVIFDIKKNELIIYKTSPQLGEFKEIVPCEYQGKSLKISFNPQYIIDVLKNLDDEVVNLEFTEVEKPAVIRKKDFLYLALPMRT
ncbi:MAG: DNA polymerase III subunit beta [Candidatus Omnitrophica bacterium]|nr:DNA polymerase III subunit beta [Candidatus Omnitrophota bacterium]MCM8825910.1 DNA polymerase III subunit beta [Candidatus Omnitrophota bacterium]